MTMDIPNRDEQHGGLEAVGQISQNLKGCIRAGCNWHRLTPAQREALDMMMHKVARILSGDSQLRDHWLDAAGYPLCIARMIEESSDERAQ
jgi:hypothetical protein